MSKLCKFSLSLAAASVVALVPTGAAIADPGLTDVPRHQHYLVTPNGDDPVPIGPDFCDDPNLQEAFNQFHNNVHHSGTLNNGPVDGAPGLDDGEGADLVAGPCV